MFSVLKTRVQWPKHEVSAWAPHHAGGQTFKTFGPEAPFRGLWDVFQSATRHGDLEFIVDGDRRLTFAALARSCRGLMHGLTTD